MPDRLLIPEKLYGRASEIDTLLASFERVAYSERCRSAFRGDGDRDFELMPITIPR
jgi:hypothetical protein